LRLLTVEYENVEIPANESPVLIKYKKDQDEEELSYVDLSA